MYMYPSEYHATQPDAADFLAQNGLAQLTSRHVKATENFNSITGLLDDEVVDMRADSNETDSEKYKYAWNKRPFPQTTFCRT